MKNFYTLVCPLMLLFLLPLGIVYGQVGIGTTTPNSDALLELDATGTNGGLLLPRIALTSTSSPSPMSSHVQGMSVYNTATVNDVSPGKYINNGSNWVKVEESAPIESVSITTDEVITSTFPTYAAVSGASVTFTARKTSVLVMLTASGIGSTNSMALVALQVRNVGPNVVLGGTVNKIQSYDDLTGTITTWSAAFSKLLTGLTVGTSYTLRVEGAVDGILGVSDAAIQASSLPDACHLTLSVIQ